MSAPIIFESISPKLESDKSLGHHNDGLITTTLPAAIGFGTGLGTREEKAFPENQRHPIIVDERGADTGQHARQARSMGYTGSETGGPSSSWVKLVKGENVLPPITPAVLQLKPLHGRVDMAMFGRYQHTEQREKYRIGWQSWDSRAKSRVELFGTHA